MESTNVGDHCLACQSRSSADGMPDISGRSCSSLNGRNESERSTMAEWREQIPASAATTISSGEKSVGGMAKTGRMTSSQTHDDHDVASKTSCSRKSSKTIDNGGVGPWLDVNHDVLFLVMMQLGFIDFFAFSGVCKSWRSVALSHRNIFMSSKPPMWIYLEPRAYDEDLYFQRYLNCYLNDFQGRRFKTKLPHSGGRTCIGVTCGYLILFKRETRDFWLVNLITRHELNFPDYPLRVGANEEEIKAILVFCSSISGWVFVLLQKKVSFCIAGKRGWNHVNSTVPIIDLHAFKGKIYTLHKDCTLSELRLHPNQKRKWMIFETKVFPNPDLKSPRILSLNGNLFMINRYPAPDLDLGQMKWVPPGMELDFDEMKWVSPEKKLEEYAFFVSLLNYSAAAIKVDSWVNSQTNNKSYDCFLDDDKSKKCIFFYERMWYFPYDCLNVNCLEE